MLYWGKLNDDIIDFYIRVSLFTGVSLLFGFFLDKWKNEKNKFAEANSRLIDVNEDLKELLILKEALEKQERLAALGTVASGIAHELKNPLSIIKTAISTLTRKSLEIEEITEVKAVIEEEISRAVSVINSVLSIAGDKDLISKKFNLSEMISGVLRLLKENLNKKKCDIIYNADSGIEITGDEQKLSRVVFNLVLNASDSVEDAGGGWVKISLERQDSCTILLVEDSGGGINMDNPDIVFTPFYTTKSNGTGLGLPITKKIIEEHDGTIECSNSLSGALFTVKLPDNTNIGGREAG
jgi:C4-dicarboxylate-specific signal transduction histidine kinase